MIVFLGVAVGQDFLQHPDSEASGGGDFLADCARWDGRHYKAICVDGYSYDPQQPSSVAFFPAFPLLARALMVLLNCRPELALILVSNGALVLALILLAVYAHRRYRRRAGVYAVLACALLPVTFFFHMAYSEALFLCVTVLALQALEGRWPLLLTAVIIGLATATRPVGVALLPVFLLHLWRCSVTWKAFLANCLSYLPFAGWGLFAYMAYQAGAFGDALAFAKTQQHWSMVPPATTSAKLLALALLEPIWGVFCPSSPHYWGRHEWHSNPLFSLTVANPVVFIGAVALVALGAKKRWLSAGEIVLAGGLLLIPYLTRAYEMAMLGQARFAAVVLPAYLVLGQLLCRIPLAAATLLLALCGFFLGTYAALFAAGYFLI